MESISRTSLLKMLEAFAAPVNEEEAWALCYQSAKYLSNQHLQQKLVLTTATDCFYTKCIIDDIGSIGVTKNGEVTLGIKESEKPITEYEQVCSLGALVYQALDYGLDLTEKQVTSTEFEQLIARMTGCEDDVDNQNESSANDTNTSSMTLSDVLEVCSEHVKAPLDAASYYADILKNLVSLYQELQRYIDKVEDSHSFEEITCQENIEKEKNRYHENWNKIMTEIKHGVTLKTPLQQPVVEHENWNKIMTEIKHGVTLKMPATPLQQPVVEHENWNKIMTEIKHGVTLKMPATPLQQPVVEKQVWERLMAELQRGVVLKKVQPRLQDDEKPLEICEVDIQQKKSTLCLTEEEENEHYRNLHKQLMKDIVSRPALTPVPKRHIRPLQQSELTPRELMLEQIRNARPRLNPIQTGQSELTPRELMLEQIRNARPRLNHIQTGQEESRSTNVAGEGVALPIPLSRNSSQNITCNKGIQNCISDFGNVEDHTGSRSFEKTQLKDENIVNTLHQSSSYSILEKLLHSALEVWENENDQNIIQNESADKNVNDQLSGAKSFECYNLLAHQSPEESLISCEIYNQDRVRSDQLYPLDKKERHLTQKKVSCCCFDANGRPVEGPSESVVVKPRRVVPNMAKRPHAFIQNPSLRQKASPLREDESRLVLNWSTIQHMKVINNLRGMCFISLLYMGNVFSYDFLSLATVFYVSLVSTCSTPRIAVSVLIFLLLEFWFIPS